MLEPEPISVLSRTIALRQAKQVSHANQGEHVRWCLTESATSGKAGGLSEVERLKAAWSVRTLVEHSFALGPSSLRWRPQPHNWRPQWTGFSPGNAPLPGASRRSPLLIPAGAPISRPGCIPGTVKLWEPPRQSRGVSRSSSWAVGVTPTLSCPNICVRARKPAPCCAKPTCR